MMKPFDLQKAIDGHPLVTRDGREVTEFHYFKTSLKDDCRAVVHGCIYGYKNDGTNWGDENALDLFLKSEKKKLYFVLGAETKKGEYAISCRAYDSIERLKKFHGDEIEETAQIVCVEIEA